MVSGLHGKRCFLPKSGLRRNLVGFWERDPFRVYYGVVSAFQREDQQVFDSLSESERTCVSECKTQSKKLDVCRKNCKLFPSVVRVLKTLRWDVTRQMRFPVAVELHGFDYSISVFNIIIHVFGMAGMRREVYSLLRDVISHCDRTNVDLFILFQNLVDSVGHSTGSVVVVDELMKNFASSSMVENAVDVLLKSKSIGIQPSIKSCNFLLKCLVEANKDVLVRCLFEEMETNGPSPNAHTYGILMNSYCNGYPPTKVDMDKASQLLEDLESCGENISDVTYSTYIHGFCKLGLVERSLDHIRSLRSQGMPVNSYVYNSFIHGFCQKGEPSEALKVLKEMKNHGTSPDVYGYGMLINEFCKRGDIRKGIDLIKKMRECGIEPSIVCYTPLLKAWLLSGVRAIPPDIFHDLSSVGYDQAAYNVLINGFSLQGDLDFASELLLEMIGKHLVPNAISFDGLIHGFCRKRLLDKALNFFQIMLEIGVSPTTFTCNVLVDAYCKVDQLDKALELMNQMHKFWVCPNSYTYNPVIDWFSKRGDWRKAFTLLPQILKRNVLSDIHCSKIIDGFSKHSKPKKAFMFYKRMQKLGVKPTIFTYTNLINMFSIKNQMREARIVFNNMVKKGLSPDTVCYTSLIDGYCKIREMEKARGLYQKMIREGCSPNLVTYTCLIDGYCKLNRMDMATLLVEEMKEKGLHPDAVTYTVLEAAYRRLGHFDKAYEISEEKRLKGVTG